MHTTTRSNRPQTADDDHAPRQGTATVADVVDLGTATFLLDVVDGPAVRAASCLLVPELGDRVWYVREGDDCYVTAVLRRAETAGPARLEVDADVELRAKGRLGLHGDDVALQAEQTVSVGGTGLDLRVSRASVILEDASMFARSIVSHVAKSTWVGTALERMVDRFVSHSRTSVRTVDGLDQLEARDFDHRATGNASVTAERVFLKGRSVVKADGDQIHLG